jgi:hypothetical protein
MLKLVISEWRRLLVLLILLGLYNVTAGIDWLGTGLLGGIGIIVILFSHGRRLTDEEANDITRGSFMVGAMSLTLVLTSGFAFGATYSINTNAAGEDVLNRAIAPGGSHTGNTKQQVLQKFVNTDLRKLSEEQISYDSRQMDDKLKVASPASKTNAQNALNAGISVPTVTPIPDQTNQINDPVSIPLDATDPDNLPLSFGIQNCPPGVRVGNNDVTGAPLIKGQITATGTFSCQVRSYKFSDIFGSTTFSWVVNP